MFIEEILKIDNLVFKPQDKLKKAKYNRIELFEDGWQNIILPNPPKNSSTETRNEIEEIKKRYDQKTDEDIQQYINSDEDSSYYIKLVLEENNMDYDSNTVEYIEDQCRPIIRHYKNHYNSQNNDLKDIEDPYTEPKEVKDSFNDDKDISSDWNDDSFKNW